MAESRGAWMRLDPDAAASLGRDILVAAGAPPQQATIVVDHLIESSRMGLHSHGLSRVPQYVEEIRDGVIDPTAEPKIERAAPSRITVDGRRGFGQVVGRRMVEAIAPVAEETGLAMATGRHLGHTGRVGAYPEALARVGLIGVAACNGAPSGHWVAPHGGRSGRISTNPMAFSWPVDGEAPVVADFSTGATAEGVIRVMRDQGTPAPDGLLQDAEGRPSNDPAVLYADPPGAIRPLGGTLGYRGTALGLLVEVLTTMLDGDHVDDRTRRGTDMTLLAIKPQPGFEVLTAELSEHIRATPASHPERPVLMPGDRERRLRSEGDMVRLPRPSWEALLRVAAEADVSVPPAMEVAD